MTLAKQITEIYLNEEDYQKKKMPKDEAEAYHQKMLESGRIITVSDGQLLCAYIEFFIEHGCCFINDLFIRPAYRRSKVIWMLRKRLKEVFKGKVYFGERNKNGNRYPEVQLRSNHGK